MESKVKQMFKRLFLFGGVIIFVSIILMNCTSVPEMQPEPTPKIKPPPPPAKFVMKSYHYEMKTEMQKSYDRADEIILGVHTGSLKDKQYGLSYYFEDFTSFDKTTVTWGPVMNVILQALPHELKPEIITQREFKNLIDLDKTGICWDVYDQTRHVFLVEGEKILIFVELKYDEVNNRSYRNLIDAYPVTKDCNAKIVFDMMVREQITQKWSLLFPIISSYQSPETLYEFV